MGDRDGDGSVNGQRSASDLGVVSTSVQNAEGEEDEVVGGVCRAVVSTGQAWSTTWKIIHVIMSTGPVLWLEG